MNIKLYWGFAILMLLICIGFVFLTLRNLSDIRQLEEELADVKDLEQHVSQQADEGNRPPREARTGHEWKWHGDHWREIPVPLNDVSSQTPASDEMVFESFELKSDLPDELPVGFPTDAELQEMNGMDIIHLFRQYKEEVRTLSETDYEAGTRLHQATMTKLGARMLEIDEEINARTEERNRKSRASAGFYPASEGSPSMTLTVSSFEDSD